MALNSLTKEQWTEFEENGYLILPNLLSSSELLALNTRLDDIMLGKVLYPSLLMQIDPSATINPSNTTNQRSDDYTQNNVEVAGQTLGFKGASMAYRKIGEAECGLECDELFMNCMQKPLFRRICDKIYGKHAAISVYRSMVMSKPADSEGGGTTLPWHQDGGEWWSLDRDPLVFVWIALSDATKANGAVQVIRGSHKHGILSKRGHTLSTADIKRLIDDADQDNIIDVELKAGQAFLCHNFTIHRSGINNTAAARRGFSVNYIDARTRVLDPKPSLAGNIGTPGSTFPLVFPSPFE
jgi:phytanoyl-CoA hydroxylase